MAITINKIGSIHLFESIPNQDYFLQTDNIKMVMDGCSQDEQGEWLKSEIGVGLFAALFEKIPATLRNKPELLEECVKIVFDKILSLSSDPEFIARHFCFTILVVYELEDRFIVKYCGDGYILMKKKSSEEVEYLFLEEECVQGCPKYYIYNYISSSVYPDGVCFQEMEFLKEEYENIGVASDGLRYLLDLGFEARKKLNENLLLGKEGRIRVQIVRNQDSMKDDITICF